VANGGSDSVGVILNSLLALRISVDRFSVRKGESMILFTRVGIAYTRAVTLSRPF
jgi:hypothetical protein